MSNQTGSRMTSYAETMDCLKKELQIHIANLKSAPEWPEFERLYRALCTVEELAGAPKTTVEQLLGLAPANAPGAPPTNAEMKSALAPGDQVESEAAAEIERGA